jgi:hypothetical protein
MCLLLQIPIAAATTYAPIAIVAAVVIVVLCCVSYVEGCKILAAVVAVITAPINAAAVTAVAAAAVVAAAALAHVPTCPRGHASDVVFVNGVSPVGLISSSV